MMTAKMTMTAAAIGMAAVIAACTASHKEAASATQPAVATAALPSGIVGANLVSTTAKVKAIDLKTRRVTLQRPDGSLVKFKAGEEVRNLPQVKVGDDVKVNYYESLAYEVKKPGDGTPGVAVSEALDHAKPGEKPGVVAGQATTMTTTIAGIDKVAGTVTLSTPDGESRTVKVRTPDNLNRVSVGDLVEITYTEALAISVETPEKE
jgi:Cu/Ag efflux protein CusF